MWLGMAVVGGVNGRGVRARVAFLPECLGVCEGARRTQNRILIAVVCVVQKVHDFSW